MIMNDPRHSLWRILQWSLLFLTTAIFVGGLAYNYAISRSNSQNLNLLQEKVYPRLEKSNLLKIKLILLQEEFYKAISQKDEERLSHVEEEGEGLVRLLLQIEPLVDDPEGMASIRLALFKYLQQGKKLTRQIIEDREQPDLFPPQVVDQMIELNQQGKILGEAIEHLGEKSQSLFDIAMKRSEEDSRRMLRVSLWSAVAGMILIGGVSSWIISLNRRLSQANQHLEEDVRLRTQELEAFVYTVSHDLKSPVVSIQGMASLFMEKYGNQLEEKGKHYIERVIANANYMEELIIGLLTLSRVGGKQTATKNGRPAEVLHQILEIHKERFAGKKIEVVLAQGIPDFFFDQTQLTQVFENLISNAAKFMGDQPHPRIEIGGKELNEGVEFYVKDNGIGIDPAYHEKVFSIFQRLKEVDVEGTGVGLSIVKKIIDLAGGKIWIESKKGEGTTFFFLLPRKNRMKGNATIQTG